MFLLIAQFAMKQFKEHRSVACRVVLQRSVLPVARKAFLTLDVLFVEQISRIRSKLQLKGQMMMKEKEKDVIVLKIWIQIHLNGRVLFLLLIIFELHLRHLPIVHFLLSMHPSRLAIVLHHLLSVLLLLLIFIVLVVIVELIRT